MAIHLHQLLPPHPTPTHPPRQALLMGLDDGNGGPQQEPQEGQGQPQQLHHPPPALHLPSPPHAHACPPAAAAVHASPYPPCAVQASPYPPYPYAFPPPYYCPYPVPPAGASAAMRSVSAYGLSPTSCPMHRSSDHPSTHSAHGLVYSPPPPQQQQHRQQWADIPPSTPTGGGGSSSNNDSIAALPLLNVVQRVPQTGGTVCVAHLRTLLPLTPSAPPGLAPHALLRCRRLAVGRVVEGLYGSGGGGGGGGETGRLAVSHSALLQGAAASSTQRDEGIYAHPPHPLFLHPAKDAVTMHGTGGAGGPGGQVLATPFTGLLVRVEPSALVAGASSAASGIGGRDDGLVELTVRIFASESGFSYKVTAMWMD